ncbi:glycoside hydrolase family 55 protein [Cohnella silvisoli]|uniref:Glycoside hydrolase family 55 protein n=1 Tax=Cohnella silvisoli TaxID=2873699 RepID=A0ABV1KX81_9BACL|nr:glycoside hydrolase family 55 protein [Cohnella silvisoli]MCD9023656.1 glycoside hydrolase family 55 protein [Cohnella silvisoli]
MPINDKDLMQGIKDLYGVLNVKSFGAKGDGVTDDTAAFIAARNEVVRLIGTFSSENGLRRGNITLYIPSGTYLIKMGKALMDDSFAGTAMGFSVIGAGRMITRIVFDPPDTNQYLFYNRDNWNQIHVSDIEFQSKKVTNNFFYSYSSGRSHGMEFERCHFGGKWGYGFHLEGTNTNSEILWYKCGFSGEWNKAFYIPASASDQFVNYDFISCQFEVSKGDFIDAQKGGSINVIGGSLLYYPGATEGGTFFKLGVGGGDHNYGAMRFSCIGARIELVKSTSKLVQCEWKSGIVTFMNIDTGTQSYQSDKNWIHASFSSNGDSFPNIVFDNCVLQGRHEYKYTFTSFQRSENITYRNCSILQHNSPEQFINLVNASGFNDGGVPQISFEKCNGLSNTTQSKYVFDTELNWSRTTTGKTTKRVVSINTANNALPYNAYPTEDVYIPLGAIITKVSIYMSPGTVTSNIPGWNFKLQTSEVIPTVLASADPVNGDTRKGFNTQQDQFFICDSDAKRHLVLVASSGVNQIKKGYCLVEYIG